MLFVLQQECVLLQGKVIDVDVQKKGRNNRWKKHNGHYEAASFQWWLAKYWSPACSK